MSGLMLVYKIFRADEWAAFQAAGETLGAPVDLADGFVHFSTATQAAETAAKHFAGEDGLVLLALDADSPGRSPEMGALARRRAFSASLQSLAHGGRAVALPPAAGRYGP